MEDKKLTHVDQQGNPTMVDVSDKEITKRTAIAESRIVVDDQILSLLQNDEIKTKKGPVFHTSIIAGVMAAKKTSDLIPFCHPLNINNCKVEIAVDKNEIVINCTVSVIGKTGVEMEALTGATVSALTVYDMCKALSHDMIIRETKLLKKTGGKSDFERS